MMDNEDASRVAGTQAWVDRLVKTYGVDELSGHKLEQIMYSAAGHGMAGVVKEVNMKRPRVHDGRMEAHRTTGPPHLYSIQERHHGGRSCAPPLPRLGSHAPSPAFTTSSALSRIASSGLNQVLAARHAFPPRCSTADRSTSTCSVAGKGRPAFGSRARTAGPRSLRRSSPPPASTQTSPTRMGTARSMPQH